MSKYVVGIVGVTGVVGQELLTLLEKRAFPVQSLKLFASQRSKDKKITFQGKTYSIEVINPQSLHACDFVFGCATNEIAQETAQMLDKSKAIFIDNSSAFRYEPNIPLVVPEINAGLLVSRPTIIANPNCTTIILAVPLWPIHQAFTITRVVVSTYQAVSGAGLEAMVELENQAGQYVRKEPISAKVFPEQILFNVMSHNTSIAENGFNGEENKVVKEMRKIFSVPNLRVSPTCMRVPVMRAHLESVNIEVEKPCTTAAIKAILQNAPGVHIVDDWPKNSFPTSLKASHQEAVLVGRIRPDLSYERGFHLLVAGDQLWKGAALNALQIAEKMI